MKDIKFHILTIGGATGAGRVELIRIVAEIWPFIDDISDLGNAAFNVVLSSNSLPEGDKARKLAEQIADCVQAFIRSEDDKS
jgi:hypothetical protein